MTAMHTDLIDVTGICENAKDAFPAWAKTAPAERASALLGAAEALEEHAEELAELNQRETGKLRADSVGGVEAGIGTLRPPWCRGPRSAYWRSVPMPASTPPTEPARSLPVSRWLRSAGSAACSARAERAA